jgi:hypothetical protein
MTRLLLLLLTASLQAGLETAGGLDSARFRYILPEDFDDWVCVDFGVDGAPPLKQDAAGVFEITARTKGIESTSSLPNLRFPPFPTEVVRIVSGQRRRMGVRETQQRSEYNFSSPVSRYCLYFGSAQMARKKQRPATLTESKNLTEPVSQHFDFPKGSPCDLKQVTRFCVNARDVDRSDVAEIIRRALLSDASRAVTTKCRTDFDGVAVRYEADFAVQTHSSARGPRFGFADVRLDRSGEGAVALAVWSDTEGGTASQVAARFGRDLNELFRQIPAKCGQ